MQKTRATNSTIIAEAISTLNSRIEKTEADFISHLQKVEDRLDQIVDLTKTVALLQQQGNQQTDQITEIRSQLRETSGKIDSTITRIHTKLDEITSHQRDKMELYTKEMEIKFDALKNQTDSTERELKQWLNRGLGAWFIIVIVFGVVQTGFYRWIDGIEKDRQAIVKQLNDNAQQISKQSQVLENIVETVKDAPVTHRRLEQLIANNEKQIELLREQALSSRRR